jgi:hypothetical protein
MAIISSPDSEPAVPLSRVLWLGPITVLLAVAGVWLTQWAAGVGLQAIGQTATTPAQLQWLRDSREPMLFTAVLVTAAVVVFVVVARESLNPIRTYRRVAFAALLLSLVPDIIAGWASLFAWSVAVLYMVMHVVAWAITVAVLTGVRRSSGA